MKNLIVLILVLSLTGCSLSAYTNNPLNTHTQPSSHASFNVQDNRGNGDVLFLLALSGGGSRAAYLSAATMLKLQSYFSDIDMLKEVDLISSVSGGSLAAAYYAISKDPEGVTVKFTVPVECDRLMGVLKSENLICDEKRRLVGVKKAMTREEKDALTNALPGEQEKITRLEELSRREVRSNRAWDAATVRDLMTRNYQWRWIGNWFWPYNALRYWFTSYDRSDIMAQTFEDNLFDVHPTGQALTFGDLNPERPYLIINSTDGTTNVTDRTQFGTIMTFTADDFAVSLGSDINSYSVARGVMASAAFPSVFNYMTLRDFTDSSDGKKHYMHVFDGGNADNLGLESVRTVIMEMEKRSIKPKHYMVILVDAFKEHQGVSGEDYDPRSLFSYIVDSNFIDTFDVMMEKDRRETIDDFNKHTLPTDDGERTRTIDNMTFWHVTFGKVPVGSIDHTGKSLRNTVNDIPTSFKISNDDVRRIDQALDIIFEQDRDCLERIRDILEGRTLSGLPPGKDPCRNEKTERKSL